MSKKTTRLAKLTRPRLHKVVARHRLFAQLDAARDGTVVWVVGPPGSGKTALLASYIEASRLRSVWYHLDGSDHDPATFFHYLSRAVDPQGRRPLPVITPEYLADLPGFTRYYFREFFARLKAPALLVLDNYQEIPAQSPLHAVIEQGAQEAPDGVTLAIISREDPPAEYARLDASDRLRRIEWDELKLTLTEATAIAALRLELDPSSLRTLHESSNGWAAGLTLALEQMKRLGGQSRALRGAALESVFNYFAGQILKTAAPDVQEFLLRTALLPRTTAEMAAALSGNAQAARLLDYFYRRRLFTDRRGEPPYNYQYHDLFRAFLLERLRGSRSADALDALQRKAGTILADAQRHDEAFALYRSAADWPAVARLALEQAQALIAQGRGKTLREWIGALPEAFVEQAPWLSYWQGLSLVAFSPDEAIEHLARASAGMEREGDGTGQIACCTAIVLAHLANLRDFRPLPAWVDRLIALQRSARDPQSPLAELYSNAALVYFCHLCQPRADYYRATLDRALILLGSPEVAPNDKVVPGCVLLHALRETGYFQACDRVIAALHPQMASAAISPGDRAYWYQVLAWTETSRGNRRAAAAACEEAAAICLAHAVSGRARHVYTHMLLAANAIQARDLHAAQRHQEQMELYVHSRRSLAAGWGAWIRSIVAAMRDDWDGAVRHADEELEILAANGAVFHLYFAHLHRAAGLIGQRRFVAAHQAIEQARATLEGSSGWRNLADVDLLAAWLALSQHTLGEFERRVAAALDLLRRTELHACLWYVDQRILPSVLARALERGIEPAQIQGMIRSLSLQAPPDAGADWPWPVRIRVLGGFDVSLDAKEIARSRKPAKKLLALLKALACAGDRGVTEVQLIDWLWPDSEGDAGRKALETALHRLRALLADADVIKTGDGRIALDRHRAWVDAWAFEAALAAALRGDDDAAQRAEALYHGTLLPGDLDAVWAVTCRERLRDGFNRLICTRAAQIEVGRDYAQALRWYARGLEADDLAESMYQGMMRCQLGLGRPADAAATYQRLRRTLTAKLRAMPSQESLALAQAASAS